MTAPDPTEITLQIDLLDADAARYLDPGAGDAHVTAWTVHQPWGHGPVYLAHPLLSGAKVQARCRQCGWCGPDRTGDPHADALVWDDSQQHAHHVGARCGIPDCAEPACLEPVP